MILVNRKVELFAVDGMTVEYSLMGEGDPILIFHGGHSNCFEEFGYQALIENGYQLITPSRAGYGRTSKEIGESLTIACKYYRKLVEHLQFKQVHVIAISAGGPTGIRFASLYPEKVKSLTLESAVSREWLTPKDMEYKAAHIIFRPGVEVFTWKMLSKFSSLFPKVMFNMMASQFSTLKKQELNERVGEEDVIEFQKMNGRQRSGQGFLIDMNQSKELTEEDLKSIASPTLIMHSKNDGFISQEHPQYALEKITDSELYFVDSWGHLIWIGKFSLERDEKLITFLQSNPIGKMEKI